MDRFFPCYKTAGEEEQNVPTGGTYLYPLLNDRDVSLNVAKSKFPCLKLNIMIKSKGRIILHCSLMEV